MICKILLAAIVLTAVEPHIFDYEDTYGNVGTSTKPESSEQAVKDLIYRLIGARSVDFIIQIQPNIKINGIDLFKISKSADDRNVQIIGSSGVAAAWGFHYYLKEFCNCHVSWDGDQLNLPSEWPTVNVAVQANDWFRYYQNVCTTSYSFVWWKWDRWERELDWMALNGYNLALAFTGQEEIWARVYLRLGLTPQEMSEHFSGPAFFSWNRMGNMRGWGGPPSREWINQSVQLQKKILKRMRDLGITPVLPAFAGYVPRAFERLFPNSSLTLLSKWCNFPDEYCCPYLLSPEDPLFQKVGSMFLKEYINEFGTNHIYNCDTFNEMTPASGDPEYLRSIGKSIYDSMTAEDPKAIWMLQGWIFANNEAFWTLNRSESLLTSVPKGKMLILDLQAEALPQYKRLDSFFGQPFIWCMLHNFGGTLGLHGSASVINEEIFKARDRENSTMVGTGLTPEGINQNYVIYDLMSDMGWAGEPFNLNEWFQKYATRRYGEENTHALLAWEYLKNTVYSYNSPLGVHGKYIVVRHPTLRLTPFIWYNATYIHEAWNELLIAASQMENITETFRIDLVDVTRQALQLKIDEKYGIIVDALKQRDIPVFQEETKLFLDIFDDLDKILATNEKFLLGKWINAAKDSAMTPLERKLFEKNARNQVTIWGPNGEIKDYANKQWSGLMRDYYKPRWKFFFAALNLSLYDIKPFRQSEVTRQIFTTVEQPFTYNNHLYPDKSTGDTVLLSNKLYKKWLTL